MISVKATNNSFVLFLVDVFGVDQIVEGRRDWLGVKIFGCWFGRIPMVYDYA